MSPREALAWLGALAVIICAPLLFGVAFLRAEQVLYALLRGAL